MISFILACIVSMLGLNLQPANVRLQVTTAEQSQAIVLQGDSLQLQSAIDIQ